jgi:hypothetical protein
LKKNPFVVKAKNLTDWDDLDDFQAKLALRHRFGFSRRILEYV